MTFNPKALVVLIGFAAVLLLAINARQGNLDIRLAIVGAIAILVIELLVTPLGYALWRRTRLFRT